MALRREKRINHIALAAILAALLATVGLALEHFAGIYEPSEITGRGGNRYALIGSFILIGWIAAAKGCGMQPTLLKRFLRGLSVALAAGAELGIAQYLYFSLVWGDFSSKMAEFTQSTLQARGADPAHIRSFTTAVRQSWQTPRVAANSFLALFVWGAALAFLVAAVSAGIGRIRYQKPPNASESPSRPLQ